MKYIFKIDIYTDGDFGFPYVPIGMTFDGDYRYYFKKTYDNKESAIENVLEICKFLKENVHSFRDWVKEDVVKCINEFIDYVKDSKKHSNFYISREMYGNYDGTNFMFYTEDDYVDCGFCVTEEEMELIKNSKKGITNEMIKEAVLDLFRNNSK